MENLNISNVRYLVGPRGLGYSELHVFYNEICESSDADWFFLMNDDGIHSIGWDKQLKEVKDYVVLEPRTSNGRGWQKGNIFPIMHRKIYETLGHFSVCNMNDCYISNVALKLIWRKRLISLKFFIQRETGTIKLLKKVLFFKVNNFKVLVTA